MKFFIDSAEVKEIREAHAMGLLDGVTTNQSLIAKSGRNFTEVIKEICDIVPGPVSAEVVTLDEKEMMDQARTLAKIAKNVVVKVPLTIPGLKTVKALVPDGIKFNVTLCFSASQALLAAKAGASFISPFIGRLDDVSEDGMQLIQDIVTIYENYQFKTEVLAASIRHPVHVVKCALSGAHVATIPFKVIEQLSKHPLTDAGLKGFMADFEKNKANFKI